MIFAFILCRIAKNRCLEFFSLNKLRASIGCFLYAAVLRFLLVEAGYLLKKTGFSHGKNRVFLGRSKVSRGKHGDFLGEKNVSRAKHRVFL